MHFLLWTKWSHESTNFDTFKHSDESLPNSSRHFPNRHFSWNFAWLFSVIRYNSSVFFFGQMLYTLHKRDKSQCKFWRIECSDQNSPNSCHFWNNKSIFLQILHHSFSIMRHNSSSPLYFFTWNLSTKGTYQGTNLVKFHLSSRKSGILHFDGLLL